MALAVTLFALLSTVAAANGDFCPESCRDCDELGNCLTCVGYNLLQLYDCVESCSTGFYPSGDACLECPWECDSCSSLEECHSCRIDFFHQAGQCVDQCSDGYYLSESRCEACSPDCLECYELGECFRCSQGTLLEEDQCRESCSDGFSAVSSDLCLPCHTGCELCHGTNQQEQFFLYLSLTQCSHQRRDMGRLPSSNRIGNGHTRRNNGIRMHQYNDRVIK